MRTCLIRGMAYFGMSARFGKRHQRTEVAKLPVNLRRTGFETAGIEPRFRSTQAT